MPHTVTLRQFDVALEVPRGQTILETALDEGLDFPFLCRGGTCGACKSVLVSGRVDLKPYAHFALTDEEVARGLTLACRAVPLSDCELAFVDPDEPADFPLRDVQGTVTAVSHVTHDIAVLRVAVEGEPLAFAAGQYARLTLPGLPPRDYSLASPPGAATLEFHVRVSATAGVSRLIYDRTRVGDRLRIKAPFGAAYLRRRHPGPIYLVAGGSGLAPVRSMLEDAVAAGLSQPIHLYFGVRAQRDLYLMDRLQALAATMPNLSFTPVLSQPEGPTELRTGLLADVLDADLAGQDIAGAKAYLCGPPVMVESCRLVLMAKGLYPEDCHADAFYTQAEIDALTAG